MPSCRGGLAEDAAVGGDAGAASRGGDVVPAELASGFGAGSVAVRALPLGTKEGTLADPAAAAGWAPGRASTDLGSDEVAAGAPASVGTMPGNSAMLGASARRGSVVSARSASLALVAEAPRRRATNPNTAAAAANAATSATARLLFMRRLGGGGSLVAWIVGWSDAGMGVGRLDAGTAPRPLEEIARAPSMSRRAFEIEMLLAPR